MTICKTKRTASCRETNQNTATNTPSIDRAALYAQLAPLVKKLIIQYGTSAQLREELTGEIYCRFSSLVDAYDPTRGIPLKPYLVRQLTASTYTFVRAYRTREGREVSVDPAVDAFAQSPSADPTHDWINRMERDSERKDIVKALSSLSKRQKNVVIWRYMESLSFDEIARKLDIETATARSILRHGLNSIRHSLGQMHLEM